VVSSSTEDKIHCLLVDEVQFLGESHIEQLRLAANVFNIPVICYGLRTDFRTNLFPGSKRMLELADCIEEVETTCHYCPNKGILNLKHVNGKADTKGPVIQLGAEEKYFPTCFHCYRREVGTADQSPVIEWSNDKVDSRMKPRSNSFAPAITAGVTPTKSKNEEEYDSSNGPNSATSPAIIRSVTPSDY
jgi:hypothetical protein